MSRGAIVAFCMPGDGHFNLLRPLLIDLAAAGYTVHAFAPARYGPAIERAGCRAVDLFAGRPMELADDESLPVPCRNVAFAATYVEAIAAEIAPLDPVLVVYETFAVVGWLAARRRRSLRPTCS